MADEPDNPLGFKRLTSEEREQKRRELLIRQQASVKKDEPQQSPTPGQTSNLSNPSTSSSNSPNPALTVNQPANTPAPSNLSNSNQISDSPNLTPAAPIVNQPASNPPVDPPKPKFREDLMKQAVQFLTSAKVKTNPVDQLVEFLKKKEMTQEEIDEAMKRANFMPAKQQPASPASNSNWSLNNSDAEVNSPPKPPSNTPSNSGFPQFPQSPVSAFPNVPPPIPPRPFMPPPDLPVAAPPPASNWKIILMVVAFVGAASAGLFQWLKKVIAPQLTKLHEYKKQLLTEKRQKMKQLSLNAQQLNTEVNQLNSRVTMDLRHNQSALLLTQEKLKKLTEVDDQHKNSVASLRDLINEVNLLITNTLVFSKSYMTAFSGDPELRNLKAEIKGLKGTLLSKNNFPAPTSMFAKKPSFVKSVVDEPKVSDS